jgi:hypothetical protein
MQFFALRDKARVNPSAFGLLPAPILVKLD